MSGGPHLDFVSRSLGWPASRSFRDVGPRRRGFSKERVRKIHHAYKLLLASKLNTTQALDKLKAEADRGEDVDRLIQFIEGSERGVIK